MDRSDAPTVGTRHAIPTLSSHHVPVQILSQDQENELDDNKAVRRRSVDLGGVVSSGGRFSKARHKHCWR